MLKEKQRLILNNEMELGENVSDEAKGKGRLFTSRFIEGGIAHYEEFGDVLITKETLNNFIHTMVGCPVIIKHKDIDDNNADKERVGVVSKVWYNDYDGWFYCEGIIWDKQAIDLVKNQGWNVSCTYDFETDGIAKTHNGKKIDMEFTNGEFLHLALVPNPRYERANIVMNAKDKDGKEGKWITIKGTHIFIPDGEDEKKVVEEFIDKHQNKSSDKKEEEKKETEISTWSDGRLKGEIRSLEDEIDDMDDELQRLDDKLKKSERAIDKYTRDKARGYKEEIQTLEEKRKNKEAQLDKLYKEQENKKEKGEGKEKSENKEYKEGDIITFDSNWRGINPRISKGEIIGKESKIATHGDTNPDYQYKVKLEDGRTILVEKEAIQERKDKPSESKAKPDTEKKDNGEGKNEVREMSDEKVKQWSGSLNLSKEQQDALYDYSTDLYNKINPLIERDMKEDDRFNEAFNQKLKNTVNTIDKIKSKLPEDTLLTHLAYESDLKKLLNVEELDKNVVGKTFTKKPYTSTAYSKESKFYKNMKDEKGRIELNIKAKKGTEAIPMEEFSFNKGEKEVLLPRNTSFKINNIEEKDGKKIITCEIVKKDKSKNSTAENSKGVTIMSVLKDLEKFVKGVINNTDDKEEAKNEDKRKIIDEIGGMLKDKVDEEVWRTIVGKLEKLSYEPSEDKKADNKSKNAEDEEEEKFEEEKEIAENKCKSKNEVDKKEKVEENEEDKKEVKNSMDDVKKLVMGGSTEPQKTYLSKEDRFALGEQY